MDYKDYSSEDFAADALFQRWIQTPDLASNTFWLSWLEQNPDKREVVMEARKLVLAFNVQEQEYSKEFLGKIWQNIDNHISSKPAVGTLPFSRESRIRRDWLHYRKIAAAVLVLLVAAALFVMLFNAKEKHTTAYGETKTLVLPDSSVVTINANSTLKYNSNWHEQQIREVWLEGEAYFQVRKKTTHSTALPSAKFIVHTGLVDVEVLGTQFNVSTRRGKAQVVLNSGKVKLNSGIAGKQNSIYMEPGELVELSENEATFTKRVVNPGKYSSWKNNRLIFDKTPLTEIAKILEDTYGWKVTITDPKLASLTFTSVVPVEKPEVLLKLLAESFHVTITRKEEQVIIGNTN